MRYERLRGVKDILPEESFLWEYVIKKAVFVLKKYNFSLIIVPTIEEQALFIRSIGDASDIVLKEMYNFQDKKGRKIALRPEATASVVRAFIEKNVPYYDFYYVGQMFRYDKPQKGRDREFYQIGVESVGSDSEYKDMEIIKLAADLINSIGIKDYEIQINNIGTKENQRKYSQKLKEFLFSNKNDLCETCKTKLERSPLRILDCKNENCKKLIQNMQPISSFIDENIAEKYKRLKNLLIELNIKFVENSSLVRGLDYYTGLVFEFVTDKIGAQQNTILAGGRYDDLIEELGGNKTPAIGFALGIERIVEILKLGNHIVASEKPDVFIVYDEKYKKEAFFLLCYLRDNNIRAILSFKGGSFKSQMRQANQIKSKFVVILGEEEIRTGKYSFKNMQDGTQVLIEKSKIIKFFKDNQA